MKTKTAEIEFEFYWHVLGFLLVASTVLLIPSLLYATATPANSDVGNYICGVAENFEGNAGRGIATIGVSVIGILALVGRITWTQALIVGVGCAVLFGAPGIMTLLASGTGGSSECN